MELDQAMPGRMVRWITATARDWDAVYTEQLPRIYNFFRYRFGRAADAEDLTSRPFEKAWKARHRYRRDIAGFATWLLSIARNVALDHHRGLRPHVTLGKSPVSSLSSRLWSLVTGLRSGGPKARGERRETKD
jgi:RNA polymerase sigma factor (sigma-70 family)